MSQRRLQIIVDRKEKKQKRSIRSLNVQNWPLADVSLLMDTDIQRDREDNMNVSR